MTTYDAAVKLLNDIVELELSNKNRNPELFRDMLNDVVQVILNCNTDPEALQNLQTMLNDMEDVKKIYLQRKQKVSENSLKIIIGGLSNGRN